MHWLLSFSVPTSCQGWEEGEILCLRLGSYPQQWSITVLKLKWEKKSKALEINGNKDRAVHCVLQLERWVAPDGAVIQLVDIAFCSPSQGSLEQKKEFRYIETTAYTLSHSSLYQMPSSGCGEIKLLLLQHKVKQRMGMSLSAWTDNPAVNLRLLESFWVPSTMLGKQ